jgi:hypothetical protein
MKPSLFVFGLIISAQISVIRGGCWFKHSNEPSQYFGNNCQCGHNRTTFQNSERKYCCVPSKGTCDESQGNTKSCADGQLLPHYQACNGSCLFNGQEKCPQINGASFTTEQCYNKLSKQDKYQCLNRKNIAEEVIANTAVVEVTSNISKRFNLFEYLESYNETFIKCKSQNNQTLEKVCGDFELYYEKRNDAISCKRDHSNVVVQLTKGDICRDVQFLETMKYTNDSISFVKRQLYNSNPTGKIFWYY